MISLDIQIYSLRCQQQHDAEYIKEMFIMAKLFLFT